MDFFEAEMAMLVIEECMARLHDISVKNGSKWNWETGENTEIIIGPEDAGQAMIALHHLIKAKQKLRKRVAKDKELYEKARQLFLSTKPPIEDIIAVQKAIN